MADLVITAANVQQASGPRPKVATAGAGLTGGQPFYFDASSNAQPAQADSAAHATIAGVVITETVAAGQQFAYAQSGAVLTIGAAVVKGANYVVSANAGKIAPDADLTAGNYVTEIGRAINTTQIQLNFNVTGVAHW